ncbi:hypothetical protein AGMMS49991_07840 [Spirochaetia bacterium]|nr:hypothetical protein AGMMS49991_07840 [Spirochaetia bacterium]
MWNSTKNYVYVKVMDDFFDGAVNKDRAVKVLELLAPLPGDKTPETIVETWCELKAIGNQA